MSAQPPAPSGPRTPAEYLRTLRIVSGGLIAGVFFFLAITVFLRASSSPVASAGNDLLAWAACAAAVASVPAASGLRAARWPAASTPRSSEKYWRQRTAAHIASMGIVEGAAFFCCVALMVAKAAWPLFAVFLPLGTMVAWFPRDEPVTPPGP